MLEWIGDLTADDWQALGTWAAVLVGGGAARYAYKQVGEARQLREAQAQPFVVVSVEQSPLVSHYIDLTIENVGHTLARDVRVTFDPPFASKLQEKDPDHYRIDYEWLAEKGLPSMPPGMRLTRVLDDATKWEPEDLAKVTTEVRVDFQNHRGEPQEPLRYHVDFRGFLMGAYLEPRTMHDLVAAVRDIRGTFKSWSEQSGRGLSVWARSGQQRDARQAATVQELHARLKRRGEGEDGEYSE